MHTLNIETIASTIAQTAFKLQTAHSDKNPKLWKVQYEKLNDLYGKLGIELQALHYTQEK
jgi:hypothetical protein